MDYLELINFDQLDLIENTRNQGGFSSIYSAVWLEGPRWNLDKEFKEWIRYGPTKVILKRLNDPQNMSQVFINQVSIIILINLSMTNCILLTLTNLQKSYKNQRSNIMLYVCYGIL